MGRMLGFGSIDCTKITKSKMVNNKDGKPAYVNVVIWENDELDKFGNRYSITESQSKEERENKEKAVYLGNLKSLEKQKESESPVVNPDKVYNQKTDDLPF